MSNPSTIRVGLTKNSQIVLHQGATDIGQGSNTVITQILADAIGASVDCIELVGADTDITPDAGKPPRHAKLLLPEAPLHWQVWSYADRFLDMQMLERTHN